MTALLLRRKGVSICFRGFDMPPQNLEELVGQAASLILERGKPIRPGVTTLAVRSAVSYKIEFESDFRLADMVPKLFEFLGGVDNIKSVRNRVKPEFLEINFVLPIKRSKAQEGGELEAETINAISRLGASVSFAFL